MRAEQEREARAQVHCLSLPIAPDVWCDDVTEWAIACIMTIVAANLLTLFLCAACGGAITCLILRGFIWICITSGDFRE